MLDGQQCTVSFCQYVNNDFSVEVDVAGVVTPKKFGNLTQTERDRILEYKLLIYFCEGNDEERLGWKAEKRQSRIAKCFVRNIIA